MSDIFREIEQEVRREEALKLWTKYQIPLIVLAVLIVAATGAWRFWENGRHRAAEAAGARYEAAMKLAAGKPAAALKDFSALERTGPAGYALLAKLQAARVESVNEPAQALKLYDAIAADRAAPASIRDAARMRAAYVAINGPDEKTAAARLHALASAGAPFHVLARELLGLLALKRKDYKAAAHWFDSIVIDPQAPAPTRARAEAFLSLVASAPRAAKTAPPAAKTAPPAATGKAKSAPAAAKPAKTSPAAPQPPAP